MQKDQKFKVMGWGIQCRPGIHETCLKNKGRKVSEYNYQSTEAARKKYIKPDNLQALELHTSDTRKSKSMDPAGLGPSEGRFFIECAFSDFMRHQRWLSSLGPFYKALIGGLQKSEPIIPRDSAFSLRILRRHR